MKWKHCSVQHITSTFVIFQSGWQSWSELTKNRKSVRNLRTKTQDKTMEELRKNKTWTIKNNLNRRTTPETENLHQNEAHDDDSDQNLKKDQDQPEEPDQEQNGECEEVTTDQDAHEENPTELRLDENSEADLETDQCTCWQKLRCPWTKNSFDAIVCVRVVESNQVHVQIQSNLKFCSKDTADCSGKQPQIFTRIAAAWLPMKPTESGTRRKI